MRETDDLKKAGDVDVSRRKLLGNLGKAAYVAPALTLLTLTTGNAQTGVPSYPCPNPPCTQAAPGKGKSRTQSRAKSKE